MKHKNSTGHKKSIFRAIFVPVIILMLLQSIIFFTVAVYGGVEDSLNHNASEILSERLINRKNEIETLFNKQWTSLSEYEDNLNSLYESFKENTSSENPFYNNQVNKTQFLHDATDDLIRILRNNRVNGVFLILSDSKERINFNNEERQEYGICIRDMDPTSAYKNRDDLLIARSPASIVESIGCSLDSWWAPFFTFESKEEGRYFYEPLNAAWDNPYAKGNDLSYFCSSHSFSESDQPVVSYSIPLIDKKGKPYGVLGVELTVKYLSSLLPTRELSELNTNCYVLAMHNKSSTQYNPIVSNGAFFNRCFSSGDLVNCDESFMEKGFVTYGRTNTKIFGESSEIKIYNNNNPFENQRLVLIAMIDFQTLFSYSRHIKKTLFWVSIFSLCMGVAGILLVSIRFASPIKALADSARRVDPHDGVQELGHVGIYEIDQLVDSIKLLNKNVSKEIARTEFFSRMSHDMRTPMNAIISFSSKELLENAKIEEKDDYLQKIHDSGEYLLGLINEVLDMTKIESNKVDLRHDEMSADSLWDSVVPMINELAEKRNLSFTKDIVSHPDLFVCTDKQHINQIVINLLSNAVKFTPSGGNVTLSVTHKLDSQDSNKIICHITIKDTGIGMTPEFLEKLYTPFEQENAGHGGTGLGLSISRKLVLLMGGTIKCESKKNQGTVFDVELPLEIKKQSSESQNKSKKIFSKALDIKKLVGKHILLCEDNKLNTQIARLLLERKGIVVDNAENGKIGLEKFKNSAEGYYDAVLMDIRMPVMDGFATTIEIRKLDRQDAKSIPIIAMTANAFEEDVKASRKAGMNLHLSKPIEPGKLFKALSDLIE